MEKVEITKSILDFLEDKKDLYTDLELSFIKNYFHSDNYSFAECDEGLRELLDVVDLLPKEDNIYDYFTDFITDRYDINNKEIIEVGGGVFARLAKRLSLKQSNGLVTVYDPRLDPTMESTDRLVLKKERFSVDTEIGKTDLLVGLMPCEGANSLVTQAVRKKRDFILWLCEGGPHGDYFDYFECEEEWMDSLMYFADQDLRNYGKRLIKIKKDKFSPYPIITNVE